MYGTHTPPPWQRLHQKTEAVVAFVLYSPPNYTLGIVSVHMYNLNGLNLSRRIAFYSGYEKYCCIPVVIATNAQRCAGGSQRFDSRVSGTVVQKRSLSKELPRFANANQAAMHRTVQLCASRHKERKSLGDRTRSSFLIHTKRPLQNYEKRVSRLLLSRCLQFSMVAVSV